MVTPAFIIWKSEIGDWEFGELRAQLTAERIIGYAIHKPTGETYNFHAGFGCEASQVTDEMLLTVCNYLDDYDCSACLLNSVTDLYRKIMTEIPFQEEDF